MCEKALRVVFRVPMTVGNALCAIKNVLSTNVFLKKNFKHSNSQKIRINKKKQKNLSKVSTPYTNSDFT